MEKSKRQKTDAVNKRNARKTHTELQRLNKFKESVQYGPIYECRVCEQSMFRNNVTILTEKLERNVESKSSKLYENTLSKKETFRNLEVLRK